MITAVFVQKIIMCRTNMDNIREWNRKSVRKLNSGYWKIRIRGYHHACGFPPLVFNAWMCFPLKRIWIFVFGIWFWVSSWLIGFLSLWQKVKDNVINGCKSVRSWFAIKLWFALKFSNLRSGIIISFHNLKLVSQIQYAARWVVCHKMELSRNHLKKQTRVCMCVCVCEREREREHISSQSNFISGSALLKRLRFFL